MDRLLNNMGLSLVFSLLGFVLLFIGWRAFDQLTAADIKHKVFEEGNVAAAILMAAFIIGLAIVVAAAIS